LFVQRGFSTKRGENKTPNKGGKKLGGKIVSGTTQRCTKDNCVLSEAKNVREKGTKKEKNL
jgi:hypothetical protein